MKLIPRLLFFIAGVSATAGSLTHAGNSPYETHFRINGLVPAVSQADLDREMCLTQTAAVTEMETVIEVEESPHYSPYMGEHVNPQLTGNTGIRSTRIMYNMDTGRYTIVWDGVTVKWGFVAATGNLNGANLIPMPDGYALGSFAFWNIRNVNAGFSVIRSKNPTKTYRDVEVQREVTIQPATERYHWCVDQGYPTHS